MKKLFFIVILFLLTISLNSQTPQRINYQAIPRDLTGQPIVNTQMTLQMTILDGGPNGVILFVERHNVNTGSLGIVNLQIGGGQTMSGSFNAINWETGNKWLKVEMDPAGGTNFQLLSSLSFNSVPYALFSANSIHAISDSLNNLLDVNTQNVKVGQTLKWDGNMWVPQNDISGGAGDNWGNQFVQTDGSLSGNGLLSTPLKLSQQGANLNQVLKWSGNNWQPAEDNWGSQAVITNATLSGNGTLSNSLKLAQQAATQGQVLKWNGSTWLPASDNGQTYIPGKGISLSNDTLNSLWTAQGNFIYANNTSDAIGIGTANLKEAKLNVVNNYNVNKKQRIGILSEFVGDDPACREEFVGIKSTINTNCGSAGVFESENYNGLKPSLVVSSNSYTAFRSTLKDTNKNHNNTTAISGYNYNESQNAIGVYGYQVENGIGVYGKINGTSFTSVGTAEVAGVIGEITNLNPGSGSCGVKGLNRGTGLNGVGVQGAQFGNGWGVWGYVSGTNASGRAIYGQSSSELGYGGYFKGRVKIEKHPVTVSPYLEIPGSNWDLQNSDGDLKIGDGSYSLKMGVAVGGAGAGDCYLLAKGGKNRLTIGQGNNTRVMTINNGNVIIGNTEATYNNLLQVNHTGYGYGLGIINGAHEWDINLVSASGSLKHYKGSFYKGTFDATSGDYSSVSDFRLKTNIQSLGPILPILLKLKAQSFNWKNDSSHRRSIGFIAQDLQKLFPEMVHQNDGKDDLLTINYSGLGVLAIKAIQELNLQIEEQQDKINALNNENSELKKQYTKMVDRITALEDLFNKLNNEIHVNNNK